MIVRGGGQGAGGTFLESLCPGPPQLPERALGGLTVSPSHISKTVPPAVQPRANMALLPVTPPPTRHTTGIERPRCVDRLPSHISKMVVPTVCGGGPGTTMKQGGWRRRPRPRRARRAFGPGRGPGLVARAGPAGRGVGLGGRVGPGARRGRRRRAGAIRGVPDSPGLRPDPRKSLQLIHVDAEGRAVLDRPEAAGALKSATTAIQRARPASWGCRPARRASTSPRAWPTP